ncbi:T9SS type A sorting domain-containing protein [Patescibacteria group bacterium]|nr:T9SS type A sorting domain-containing protein [Patescibacteria group bacterium]
MLVCSFQSWFANKSACKFYQNLVGGFGGRTLELNYDNLSTIKILQSDDFWDSWRSMAYDTKDRIYAFHYGGFSSSSPFKLDLREYDINAGNIYEYMTTDNEYSCSSIRSIAITSDGNTIIVTNSPENTISILYKNPPTAIEEDHNNEIFVSSYSLSQNYPNPFNPTTIIKYDLPKEGMVLIKIHDLLGREVKTLVNEYKSAGSYNVELNASNLTSGIYLYKLTSRNFTQVKKLILMK